MLIVLVILSAGIATAILLAAVIDHPPTASSAVEGPTQHSQTLSPTSRSAMTGAATASPPDQPQPVSPTVIATAPVGASGADYLLTIHCISPGAGAGSCVFTAGTRVCADAACTVWCLLELDAEAPMGAEVDIPCRSPSTDSGVGAALAGARVSCGRQGDQDDQDVACQADVTGATRAQEQEVIGRGLEHLQSSGSMTK